MGTAGDSAAPDALERAVWEALAGVTDPELPVSLVDLGMIYRVESVEPGTIAVDLTFTSMGCPGMDMILEDLERAVRAVPGVERLVIEVVWSPPWTKARLSETGRRVLVASGLSV